MNSVGSFMSGAKRAIVELAGFSFVVNVLLLVMPIYMLQVYDRVLTSGSSDTLVYLSLIAGAALVLLGLIEAVRGIYASRLGARLAARMGRGALMASLHGPRAPMGDVQYLRDMQQVRSFLSGRLVFALFDAPFAPFFILLLYFIHPALCALTAVGAVVLGVIAWANQRATRASSAESGEAAMAANLAAQTFARNRESLQAMGMMDAVVSAWGKRESASLAAQDSSARTNAWFTGLSRTVRMGLQIAVLGYGAWLVLNGQMTAGMIFASSIISGRALQPIDQLIGGWRTFVDVGRSWRTLSKVVKPFEKLDPLTEQAVPEGQLIMENVVYAVPEPGNAQGRAIIKRVSGGIRAGEMVGVIGPSGAGKSTLLRLMVGALVPTQGTVRLDEADMQNWPPEQRGRYIGYLSQDAELLPGTVKDNIARFAPDASDADVRAAAENAGVTGLIQRLPKGFDTVIGPGGHQLSGGERQRIGLARAFFRMPRLIVLDEPNAALDETGSAALEAAIKRARDDGATVVVAAQRRDVVRIADKVMYVEDGQVARFGTLEEVGRWFQERAEKGASNVAQLRKPGDADSYTSDVAKRGTTEPAPLAPGGGAPRGPNGAGASGEARGPTGAPGSKGATIDLSSFSVSGGAKPDPERRKRRRREMIAESKGAGEGQSTGAVEGEDVRKEGGAQS